jgi:uncharacterized protein (TIGR02271 family)
MEKDASAIYSKANTSKGIVTGMIIGGILGILLGFVQRTGILFIPIITNIFYSIALNEIITGALLGIIIGGLIGALVPSRLSYSTDNINEVHESEPNIQKQSIDIGDKDVTFDIKEEHLDIAKKLLKTGEVNVYREVFSEEKTFTIPVEREELVIEKKDFTSDSNAPLETILIPLSQEKVEVSKYKVTLEEVSVYKEQIKDIKHIEETLKKEEPKVDVSGSPRILDKANLKHS